MLVRGRGRPGEARAARGPGRSRPSSPASRRRPMSATTTSPQRPRPGSSTWAGFLAWKVTVSAARAAGPSGLAGVARHAARHVDRHHPVRRLGHAQGRAPPPAPSSGRDRPGAEQGVDPDAGSSAPFSGFVARPSARCAAWASWVGGLAQRAHLHRPAALLQQPRRHIAVAAVVAGPAEHQGRLPRKRAQTASATAVPARSISVSPGVPAAIAAASAGAISRRSGSGVRQPAGATARRSSRSRSTRPCCRSSRACSTPAA